MSLGVRLRVRVEPNASGSEIVGWVGSVTKVKVAAAPEKGKANRALLDLLARRLETPEQALSVLAGHASRSKTVLVQEVTEKEMHSRLGQTGF